jgi:molybdopterin/thiamine biosynthesis adenylyltransferase
LVSKETDTHKSYIARNTGSLARYFNQDILSNDFSLQRAIYVPLQEGSALEPPRHDQDFWTIEQARSILGPLISDRDSNDFARLARKHLKETELVILGLPRPAGGLSIFGLRYSGVKAKHPLLVGGRAEQVQPLVLMRRDKSYLISRGGGANNLADKHVLLAGAGSIGGHLAFELVRAGILRLTIVDPDTFEPDNTFRHALGQQCWWQYKAEALGKSITRQFPYVRTTAHVSDIEPLLADRVADWDAYDLIILATGDPTAELEMNSHAHRLKTKTPLLFTWLEPYGIGGHALAVNNTRENGCLECLYTSSTLDINEHLANRASFAAPNQFFGVALRGCGSLHTPYGSVAALQTTALATNLAIDTLTGAEKGNALRSWKGDARLFLEAGFDLSSRYDCSTEELSQQAHAYSMSNCKVCGTARAEQE